MNLKFVCNLLSFSLSTGINFERFNSASLRRENLYKLLLRDAVTNLEHDLRRAKRQYMTNVAVPAVKVQRECREVQSVPVSPPSRSCRISTSMCRIGPLDDLLESPRIDDWSVKTASREDYPRYHRDVLILDIREVSRRIVIRSLGEMKAAEKRRRVSTDSYLPCLSSDMEWQLWRFDCSVHSSSLDGRSLCVDEVSTVSNSVNHAKWKESCVRANLYLSFTSVEWQLVARERNIFIKPLTTAARARRTHPSAMSS